MDIYNILKDKINADNILLDEPMSKHTTFAVGGLCDYYILPHTVEELKDVISICQDNKMPYMVIGNGSNLLISDAGIRGVIISTKQIKDISVDKKYNTITAKCGVSLSQLADAAYRSSLTGAEFAAGIPGSIGGAIVMNAGAYGSEIKDILVDALILHNDGNISHEKNADMSLGYRTSNILDEDKIVLAATFAMQHGDTDAIKSKMEELAAKRRSKQPLDKPSAGSTFKRPLGHYAGQLIEEAGLKGYRIGGAIVSEKHCGFIVNDGNATASDIYHLIKYVRDVVYDKSKVMLDTEVKIIGEID